MADTTVHPALPTAFDEEPPRFERAALDALTAAEEKVQQLVQLVVDPPELDAQPADKLAYLAERRANEDAVTAEAVKLGTGALFDLSRAVVYALVGVSTGLPAA